MTVREKSEQIEQAILSPYAVLSINTKGRAEASEACAIRTCFQVDRDRVLHSKAFRRLKQKTQVFISPEGDHYRTRLTHTLEVSQIARTIARALRLNEDLTEAIALGHDLGHTPFGHAGEAVLNKLNPSGFKHFLQSVRVVTQLERGGRGLNLTAEVINGIETHTRGQWADTLEGQVVRHADRIAYINHDIEDAITAGVLKESDLPKDITAELGTTKSMRITKLITSLIENSGEKLAMDEATAEKYEQLHKFMYDFVYIGSAAKVEEGKVELILSSLYNYFLGNIAAMQPAYIDIAEREGVHRAVTDYISGMSDDYAVKVFEDIYIPRPWDKY